MDGWKGGMDGMLVEWKQWGLWGGCRCRCGCGCGKVELLKAGFAGGILGGEMGYRCALLYQISVQSTPNRDKREVNLGSFMVPSPNLRVCPRLYQQSLAAKDNREAIRRYNIIEKRLAYGEEPILLLLNSLSICEPFYHEATVKKKDALCVSQCACVGTVQPVAFVEVLTNPRSMSPGMETWKVSIGREANMLKF